MYASRHASNGELDFSRKPHIIEDIKEVEKLLEYKHDLQNISKLSLK